MTVSQPRPSFPRPDDGLGHAWQLTGETPVEVWERLSPAYEAQAGQMWDAFAARGWHPALDFAGSQDGEAIIGRDDDGEIVCLFHLEEPAGAQEIAEARAAGRVNEFIDDELRMMAEAMAADED